MNGLPLALGAVGALASLIPIVGTALVWVPLTIQLVLAGKWGTAAFVLNGRRDRGVPLEPPPAASSRPFAGPGMDIVRRVTALSSSELKVLPTARGTVIHLIVPEGPRK